MFRKNLQHINLDFQKKDGEKSIDYQNFGAGIVPFLRGNSSTMYVQNKWNTKPVNSIIIHSDDNKNQLSNLLLKGLKVIKNKVSQGEKIDTIACKLVFNWTINTDFFTEIAKMRAARLLWSKLMKQFTSTNLETIQFKTFIKANNYDEAQIAILGGADYIEMNDDLKLYIENETKITKTVDPFGGSYQLENLTKKIIEETWELIKKND